MVRMWMMDGLVKKVQSQRCFNNLKQIGTAIGIYAINNQDRYPWQVPQSEGGTAEIAQPRSDTDALLDSDGKPIFDANAWMCTSKSCRMNCRTRTCSAAQMTNHKLKRIPSQAPHPKRAGRNIIPFDKNSVSYWLRTARKWTKHSETKSWSSVLTTTKTRVWNTTYCLRIR